MEKLGSFYLGRTVDPLKKKGSADLLLYNSKDLTTHAVCVGMTGSGKTGLGIVILEEAAIDKIPAIIIDPKGDLGNLLLTFPNLSAEEFLPWIDPAEAARKEMEPAAYAEFIAKTWKDGLASWGEGPERIETLRNSVEMIIYTPGSRAGVPISILSSFAAPAAELQQDSEAFRNRVMSITSSLLGLIGIEADPVKSREHILISTIIMRAWEKGLDLNIATLIQQVQKPLFDKIGALDIDTFFPPKERLALSVSLNNLLASPGFQTWMEGEPLDIQQLFYNKEGKPKLSILSIAHLSNAERMFFVTLLLNELIAWMRRQPGTSSLRALFYMDEIFGFFPPTAMPPSKLPMLTLLKQARAYGLGVILATQNPVDLDYKGLSNCGTWFIGKLQTERDKKRVLDGLQAASNGELDANTLEKMIASTGNRVFIMRSIYEKAPVLFETRWTMSYLRGPLTLTQISKLTQKIISSLPELARELTSDNQASKIVEKPIVPSGISEFFWIKPSQSKNICYRPLILGSAKLHFVDTKNKIDTWQGLDLLAGLDQGSVLWDESENFTAAKGQLQKEPIAGSSFEELPLALAKEKNYASFEKSFLTSLYQNQTLTIFQLPELNLSSQPNQSEGEFRSQISLLLREKRDESIKKLQTKYADKIAVLTDRVRRAEEKVTEKKQKRGWLMFETALSFMTSLIEAFMGRGVTKGTISKAGTSMRRAGKIGQGNQDATRAEEDCGNYKQQLDDLQEQLTREIAQVSSNLDANVFKLETLQIRPRKSDIVVEKIALVWSPILKAGD